MDPLTIRWRPRILLVFVIRVVVDRQANRVLDGGCRRRELGALEEDGADVRVTLHDLHGGGDDLLLQLQHVEGFSGLSQHLGELRTFGRRDDARALAYFAKALSLDPESLEALTNTGKIHTLKKEFGQAATILERAVATHPDYAPALSTLGGVRIAEKRYDDAEALLKLADERHLEGIVVKRLDSTYQPGARNTAWQKIKIRRRQEFVVGGWLVGHGSLDNQIGSLMVGVYDGADLIMAGRVGSGLTDVERKRLATMLEPRSEMPFKEVPALDKVPVWVEPTVVVEVEYGEWPRGAMLRHPTYCGIRIDRDPADVVRENEV